MKLNELQDNDGARKPRMRVGRGIGSGKGKTCGRGYKGQKSRTGVSYLGEGGQTPLYMRIPKRGFNNPTRREVEVVNLSRLEQFVTNKKIDGGKVSRETLVEAGLVKSRTSLVKILGTTSSKVVISADLASKSAIESIEKAGGKITLPQPKAEKEAA